METNLSDIANYFENINNYKNHIRKKKEFVWSTKLIAQFYISIVSSVVKHLVKSTLGSEMPCRRAAQIAPPNLLKKKK